MKTIYDDPIIAAQPTAEQIRISELQAIVSTESEIRHVATVVQDSLAQAEQALRDKSVVLHRALDRELAPFVANVNRLHGEAAPLREQIAAIEAAKAELLELLPIGKQIAQLEDRLHQITTRRSLGLGTLNENDPIRPVMLERIELLERTDQVHLASAERRKLKRLDDDVAEIQAEIAALKASIGIAS